MPDTFPADMPIFPDGQILGTVMAGEQLKVVLQTDRSQEEGVDWYREQLGAAGWREPRPVGLLSRGGFTVPLPTDEDAETAQVAFCRTATGPSARIIAIWRKSRPTEVEVQVNLSTDPRESPCTAAERCGVRCSDTFGQREFCPLRSRHPDPAK